MKITLVTPSLFCGGAERVVVSLAEGFSSRGHEVTVVSFSRKDTDFYQLPPGVARVALDIMKESDSPVAAISSNLRRLSIVRNAIATIDPDVVIAHLTTTSTLTTLALVGTKYPVIVTEHCDPNLLSYGKLWETLRRIAYPLADNLVSVSQGVADYFTWLPEKKKTVIYNPFLVSESAENPPLPPGVDPDKKWIVSMGRLTYQKGFDLLLKAFASIAGKYPDWQLIILGEGELRTELETQIKNSNLEGAAILPGRVSPPFPLIKQAELFVMSSRFEGFPMAHGEAMLCGVPILATDCPSGPRELIRHDIDGILIPKEDVTALANGMENLITHPETRARLAANAPEVGTRFSLEKISKDWENLIQKII